MDASFAAVVATHVVTALALTALIGAMLLRLHEPAARRRRRCRRASEAAERADRAEPEPPLWVGFLLSAVALAC